MPPRWFCICIVLAWFGTTGPLVYKEVRKLFLANQPPPFTIELMDETAHGEKHKIPWTLHIGPDEPKQNTSGHKAESWVKYHVDDNTFSFHTELRANTQLGPIAIGPLRLRKMESQERVAHDGYLRSMRVHVDFDFDLNQIKLEHIRLSIEGKVENNSITPVIIAYPPLLPPVTLPSATFSLPPEATVLLPLHLVNRIRGLRPGQTWVMPQIDPVKTGMNFTGTQKTEMTLIQVEVQPEEKSLPGYPAVKCLVIEYDTPTKLKTWVQVGTDLVMRQESMYDGQRFILQRFNLAQ